MKELREFIERRRVEGVHRENEVLVLGLAVNAIRDAGCEELAAMVRMMLTEGERQLEYHDSAFGDLVAALQKIPFARCSPLPKPPHDQAP